MANDSPVWKFPTIGFNGIWDESETPVKVGAAGGMTACQNLIYRRYGSWSKRSGSGTAYVTTISGSIPAGKNSGIRWYHAFQNAFTQTVIASQGALWIGAGPGSTQNPADLTQVATFSGQAKTPIVFAPARDPSADHGTGDDVLIMTGWSGAYAYATSHAWPPSDPTVYPLITGNRCLITGMPGTGTPVTVTLTVTLASNPQSPQKAVYTILPTDNPTTIAMNLCTLINETFAVSAPDPWIQAATYKSGPNSAIPSAEILLGAYDSGTAGNAVTYEMALSPSGGTVNVNPTSPANLKGGGGAITCPMSWDGTTVKALSYQITQPFTGCVTWHNHVWYWGDANNPSTLYASDINEPRGWTFMTQEGGYPIGAGDGDPTIQTCVPIGNTLYVFKTSNIYAITGYDFQTGEYQFQVSPQIIGKGVPAPGCVAVLSNSLVFWTGSMFERLAVGAFETEYIGAPMLNTQGLIANGDPTLMRAVAGDFTYLTALNEVFDPPVGVNATDVMTNTALFACDIGRGAADAVLVFDDSASVRLKNYAWSLWTGWTVGGWLQFGSGPNDHGTGQDTPSLFWITPGKPIVNQYGSNIGIDSTQPILWTARTGWITTGTLALKKDLHRIFLEIEATNNVVMSCAIITPSNPVSNIVFPATSVNGREGYQVLIVDINPAITDRAFLFSLSENGSNVNYEVTSLVLEAIEEPYKP